MCPRLHACVLVVLLSFMNGSACLVVRACVSLVTYVCMCVRGVCFAYVCRQVLEGLIAEYKACATPDYGTWDAGAPSSALAQRRRLRAALATRMILREAVAGGVCTSVAVTVRMIAAGALPARSLRAPVCDVSGLRVCPLPACVPACQCMRHGRGHTVMPVACAWACVCCLSCLLWPFRRRVCALLYSFSLRACVDL